MKDFTAWVDAWNAYDKMDCQWFKLAVAIFVGITLIVIGVVSIAVTVWEEGSLRVGSASVVAMIGAGVCFCSFSAFSSLPTQIDEPPSLETRIAKVWKLERIDCGGWFPTGNLPADGDSQCVAYATDRRFAVTVHVDGKEVGLYLNDGKVLKPLGKDATE